MATQSEIQALINQIVPDGNYTAVEMNTLLTTMLSYTSSIVDIERVALQSLISSGSVNTNAIYKITDGVSDTKVIFVFGLTTASLTGNALNITDGTFGTYDITTDVYQSSGGTILTPDQVDAIEGANAPDSTNVFATINDLQNPDLSDVYTEGNTVNGYALTMDSDSGGILGITLNSNFAGSTNVVAFGEAASSGSTHTNAVAIGDYAASSRAGTNIVALGNYAGNFSEGSDTNALGLDAGRLSKVTNLNALGNKAAYGIGTAKTNLNALGSEAARANLGDNVNALGNEAARDNTGASVNALGIIAAQENTGTNVNALGSGAAYINTANNVNALGGGAAQRNTGPSVNALGFSAAYLNSGENVNGLGSSTSYQNNGDNVNAMGAAAAYDNVGDNTNALGQAAAQNNQGANVNAFGNNAARLNGNNDINAFGSYALYNNTGLSVNALGVNAGRNNSGSYCNFIGFSAGYNVGTGIGNSLASQFVIANTSMPSYADRTAATTAITVALGAVANNTYLYYNATTFAIEAVRL